LCTKICFAFSPLHQQPVLLASTSRCPPPSSPSHQPHEGLCERHSPPPDSDSSDTDNEFSLVQFNESTQTAPLNPLPRQHVYPGFRREYHRSCDPNLQPRLKEWHSANNDQAETPLRDGLIDEMHLLPHFTSQSACPRHEQGANAQNLRNDTFPSSASSVHTRSRRCRRSPAGEEYSAAGRKRSPPNSQCQSPALKISSSPTSLRRGGRTARNS
jgi:hypothetical protein